VSVGKECGQARHEAAEVFNGRLGICMAARVQAVSNLIEIVSASREFAAECPDFISELGRMPGAC